MDGVIHAINGGMVLRSYVETYKDLSLERLRKIIRNHYDVKSATELYQSLVSICQGSKETPQEFLMACHGFTPENPVFKHPRSK